ncbi:MAG: mechanosensitive ion channel family protein [Lachnospiraceae bacterium]|nr:mechanosensitive ion channel family protein [Lachnospiraceae bacterium]
MLNQYFSTLPEKLLNLGIRVLVSAICVIIGIKLIGAIRKLVKHSMERFGVENYLIHFVDSVLKVLMYVLLALLIAGNFGVDAASIVAVVGSVGITIGLALQGSLANFAGGVLILILKPFKVGDYILEDTNKNEGKVQAITMFYTTLQTYDGKAVMIPNGILSNASLTNYTGLNRRMIDLSVGIDYSSDIKKAKEVIYEVMRADPSVLEDSEPIVFVRSLGDSAVVMGGRLWVAADDYFPTLWRLNENVKLALDANKISIPFNQLDVHLDGVNR